MEARCQESITLKSALTCSSAFLRPSALVKQVLEETRRAPRDHMLSVSSDDDSGSLAAQQELKLIMHTFESM